jgi:hypothetical protein
VLEPSILMIFSAASAVFTLNVAANKAATDNDLTNLVCITISVKIKKTLDLLEANFRD